MKLIPRLSNKAWCSSLLNATQRKYGPATCPKEHKEKPSKFLMACRGITHTHSHIHNKNKTLCLMLLPLMFLWFLGFSSSFCGHQTYPQGSSSNPPALALFFYQETS